MKDSLPLPAPKLSVHSTVLRDIQKCLSVVSGTHRMWMEAELALTTAPCLLVGRTSHFSCLGTFIGVH